MLGNFSYIKLYELHTTSLGQIPYFLSLSTHPSSFSKNKRRRRRRKTPPFSPSFPIPKKPNLIFTFPFPFPLKLQSLEHPSRVGGTYFEGSLQRKRKESSFGRQAKQKLMRVHYILAFTFFQCLTLKYYFYQITDAWKAFQTLLRRSNQAWKV